MANTYRILTRELIEACRTTKYGFTRATTLAFAEALQEELMPDGWTLRTGWVQRLEGLRVNETLYQRALGGRYVFKSKAMVNQPGQLSLF